MADFTEADYAAAGITWAEDLREATRIMRRRRALWCATLVLGAVLMFSAGMLFERLVG
jgi:hypothetical protein